MAGSILAVLALYSWFFPRDEEQANVSGELAVLRRDPNVRLGPYLRAENRPVEGISAAGLREVGNVFTLRLVLTGVQGRNLPLRWTIFDADSATALGQAFNNRLDRTLRPSTAVGESETAVQRVWVPLPTRTGRFFVRFDLGDGEGGVLGTTDSEPFPITAVR
jgi:hypothetical protein